MLPGSANAGSVLPRTPNFGSGQLMLLSGLYTKTWTNNLVSHMAAGWKRRFKTNTIKKFPCYKAILNTVISEMWRAMKRHLRRGANRRLVPPTSVCGASLRRRNIFGWDQRQESQDSNMPVKKSLCKRQPNAHVSKRNNKPDPPSRRVGVSGTQNAVSGNVSQPV